MSWDLFIQSLPEGITTVTEIPGDFQPQPLQMRRGDLISVITEIWPTVDKSDPAWLVADSDSWSIEFNLGRVDPVETFALHVRGNRPPLVEIARLLDDLGVRAIDPQAESGLFKFGTSIENFGGWAAYRDRFL